MTHQEIREQALRDAQQAIQDNCGMCDGHGYTIEIKEGSTADHAPDCDGSCRNCPIEVPTQEQVQEPCEYCGRPIAEIGTLLAAPRREPLGKLNLSQEWVTKMTNAEEGHDVSVGGNPIRREPETPPQVEEARARYKSLVTFQQEALETAKKEIERLTAIIASPQRVPETREGWQPIATAPEATWVLVRVPNYGLNIATMTSDPNIMGENGKYWFIRGEDDRCHPTHWMPLPALPSAETP